MSARTHILSHFLIGVLLLALGAGAARAAGASPQAVQLCTADLAKRLSIPAAEITVSQTEATDFPDTALGLPEPDQMYAQVITSGCVVILQAKNTEYLYTTAAQTFRYGGPFPALPFSALYLERVPDEANLNGNVVQIALAGVDAHVVMPAVTAYWPQPNGSLIGARRTSRSGFDLLYMAPGKYGESIRLASAFSFGDAAVNTDGTRWIAYSRPQVGGGWQVTWGETKEAVAGDAVQNLLDTLGRGGNRLGLPDGTTPGRLYWHLTNPVAVLRQGEDKVAYELVLNADKPQWRKFEGFYTPPTEEFMLNKSETLVVKTEKNEPGQPVTRIIRQWFDGGENVVARIGNFTPDEMSLAGRRLLVLSGKRGEQPLGFTVDIATGEVLETVKKSDGPVRLLQAPAQGWVTRHLTPAKLLGPQ